MLTVIIVEESDWHRKHLRDLINWGRHGWELVGVFGDGLAAMEAIYRYRPDLVITNGKLTGFSGISLIENAQTHGLSSDFVIVEDTEDFEIALSVMHLGVQEYLIKPVSEDKLTHVLQKYSERRQALNGHDINEHFLQTRRLLRNAFMDSFTSINAPEHFSIDALNKKYHFQFKEGIFHCAVLVISSLPHEEEGTLMPTIVESIRARFDPVCHEMIPYVQGPGRATLIFNYDEGSKTRERLPELESIIKEHLRKRSCKEAIYSIGVGLPERDVRMLKRANETAERAVRCGMLREQNQQYFYEDLKFDKLAGVDLLTQTLMSELVSSAEALDINKYEKAVRNAFSPISVRSDPAGIMYISWAAVEAVVQAFRSSGENVISAQARKDILDSLGGYPTLLEMIAALVAWAKTIFDGCLKEREYSRPVRESKAFIKNNCTNPLTLEFVAEQVHLNASYFSTVFKKETGKNFSEYLTDCRIEEAKRLLRESTLNISQICTAVGYTDNKHFSRIFTRIVGIKPSLYRSLHG